MSFGEIRGTINGEDIGVVLLNASWHSNNLKKTYFNISLIEIKRKFVGCFKIYTGLLTPVLWFEAYEVSLHLEIYAYFVSQIIKYRKFVKLLRRRVIV